MKKVMQRIRMRRAASQIRRKSVDPLTAYKARLEVGIYTWLLDLIAKEMEAEQKAPKPDKPKKTTVTETMAAPAPLAAIAQAGVQTA